MHRLSAQSKQTPKAFPALKQAMLRLPGQERDTPAQAAEQQPSAQTAKCVGNNKLPIPNKGYWIDRAQPKFSGTVMQCPRGEIACDGGIQRQTNKDCWSLSNFTSCSPDLACTPGSTGPLCGACEEGFALNSLARTCDDCRQDSWQLFGPYAILAAVAALVVPLVFVNRKIIAKHEPMRMRKAMETIFDLGQSFLSSVMSSLNF